MKNREGSNLESYLSARGIQQQYAKKTGQSIKELNDNKVYPMQILERALQSDIDAISCLKEMSKHLSLLIFERISTLFFGWRSNFEFINPNKVINELDHPYRGRMLERIIIGQRLGDLLTKAKDSGIIWPDLQEMLSSLIKRSGSKELSSFYFVDGLFDLKKIRCSSLREAPALGAGIDAFFNYKIKANADQR